VSGFDVRSLLGVFFCCSFFGAISGLCLDRGFFIEFEMLRNKAYSHACPYFTICQALYEAIYYFVGILPLSRSTLVHQAR